MNSFKLIVPVFACIQILLCGQGEATEGVDVSAPISKSAFDCLKKAGKTFAIVRVWQSTGHQDPNGVKTIGNAWAAGFSHVDGYIFPCYKCGEPK